MTHSGWWLQVLRAEASAKGQFFLCEFVVDSLAVGLYLLRICRLQRLSCGPEHSGFELRQGLNFSIFPNVRTLPEAHHPPTQRYGLYFLEGKAASA